MKNLEGDKILSDIDRVQIINNHFKNKAELILKVPAVGQLSDKNIKAIQRFLI